MATMQLNPENVEFLEHHGVKGMRWGVRKKQKQSYSQYMKKEQAYERLNVSEGGKLPKNWKKQMAEVEVKDAIKIKRVKKVVAAVVVVWAAKQALDLGLIKTFGW